MADRRSNELAAVRGRNACRCTLGGTGTGRNFPISAQLKIVDATGRGVIKIAISQAAFDAIAPRKLETSLMVDYSCPAEC
jgi:hypothetical protein